MTSPRGPLPRRRSAAGGRVLAVVALTMLLTLTGCGTNDDEGGPAPSPTVMPTRASSTAPTSSPGPSETRVAGVYFMVDTRTGLRLAREMRDLDRAEPETAAVEAMVAGADDPDYSTPWDPGTEVLGIARVDGVIRVDLSAEARQASIGSEGAALMVQQLVYTVTEAAGDHQGRVQLLIEGEPAGELWGALTWDRPVTRADPDNVRMLVQLDRPREGEVVTGPLRVRGEANVFEATVVWRILRADGSVVDSSFVMTREGFEFSPFAFGIVLDPGTYVVEVSEDDPSAGEAGPPMKDSRTVTIRG